MSRGKRQDQSISKCVISLVLLFLAMILIDDIDYFIERNKEKHYTENKCFVLNSKIVLHTCYKSDDAEPNPDPDDATYHKRSNHS